MMVMVKFLLGILSVACVHNPVKAFEKRGTHIIVDWNTTFHGAQNVTGILEYDFDFDESPAPSPEVVRIWHEHKTCETNYFRMNDTNFKASKAAEWYRNIFLHHWKDNAPRAEADAGGERLKEPVYFGEVFLGVDNFKCDIVAGRCGIPVHPGCPAIVNHVRGEDPNLSDEQVLEEARRRHFIALSMDQTVNTGWQVRVCNNP